MDPPTESSRLPIERDLSTIETWSLVIAVLVAIMSLIGLLFTDSIYPTQDQVDAYRANDLMNISIGLPALAACIWMARRSRWIGLLFWPGTVMYVLYNYIAVLVGIPLGWPTLAFAAVVVLSAYLLFDLLRIIDGEAIRSRMTGALYERFSGGMLALFGVAFFALAFGVIQDAGVDPSRPDVGVAVADMVLSALLLVSGVLFSLRRPSGYASAPGMLCAAMLLFVGVILVVVVRPYLSDVAFSWNDLIVLSSMAVVCSVPFVLTARGIVSRE